MKTIRPSAVIAAGLCGLLAVVILLKQFHGSGGEPGAAPSVPVAARGRVDAPEPAGGWMAKPDVDEPQAAEGRSRPPRGPAGSRASGAHDEGSAKAAAAAGAGATGALETKGAASATGSATNTADAEPIRAGSTLPAVPVAGVHGGDRMVGTGSAAAGDVHPADGGHVRPAPAQPGAAPINPEQGVTLFTGAESCQGQPTCNAFPADSRLNIADARKVIAGAAGTMSFSLQPQWQADDLSHATLVNLGDGDTNQNRFEISKDGQSLHFAFVDNSGTQTDTSAPIDGWQPGEPHLVTATWGQGQVSFFVDGKLAGQQPYSGQLEVGNGVPLSIGSGYPGAQTVPGVFSDFHFYKRALTAEEVAGQAATSPGQGAQRR